MEDVTSGPAPIRDIQMMVSAEKDGTGCLQRRATLQEEQARQVEVLVAGGGISLSHQFYQLFATDLNLALCVSHGNQALIGMYPVDIGVKGA